MQLPDGGVGHRQGALEAAEGAHVGGGFGAKAEQPPGEQANPDAMAKEQAAVFELRVVVEKGTDAPVEGGEAVRTRAGACLRVGALPVGICQRAARRAVHAAN